MLGTALTVGTKVLAELAASGGWSRLIRTNVGKTPHLEREHLLRGLLQSLIIAFGVGHVAGGCPVLPGTQHQRLTAIPAFVCL